MLLTNLNRLVKFYVIQWDLSTIFSVNEHQFAAEAAMSSFHHADERPVRPRATPASDRRLSVGRSVVVIAGLSALSWAVLIGIGMAAWSAL